MSASRLLLLALACSAGLAAASPTGGTGKPSSGYASSTGYGYYSSCNETASGGPTGATGTGPAGTGSSSTRPLGTAPSGTAPSGTAPSGTAPSGTAPSGTAPTRSSGLNATSGAGNTTMCSVTTTSTTYLYSTITTGPISTVTYFGAGPIIDGDALTPVNGTATASITGFTTTTIQSTTTLTVVTFPQVTVGDSSTITIPPPSAFLPVQSTLPNATYEYKNPCDVSTSISTSTTYQIFFGPAVTTLSGTVIVFTSESTYYPSSAFTNFSISYVTATTYTATEYLGTATTTTAATFTNTFTVSPTTVYAACATSNFADSVVVDHLPQQITFFDTLSSANQSFGGLTGQGQASPFDCCNYAFAQGADVWTYAAGLGCALVTGTDGLCTPAATNDTAEINGSPDLGALKLTIGNGVCARFTRSTPDSAF